MRGPVTQRLGNAESAGKAVNAGIAENADNATIRRTKTSGTLIPENKNAQTAARSEAEECKHTRRLAYQRVSERTTSRSPLTCHYRSAGFFHAANMPKGRRTSLSYDSPDSVRSPVKYFSVKMESRRMPTSFSPPSGMIRSAYFLEGSMNASCIGLTVVRY